ncbi:hypothetical protein [Bradyrhizobium guangdongense]|uniref:hypothetical protein n=1 Tax=Bradyrhizobium guangdongense TaxID=1325090 RepID=UPI001319E960|nr:hypothetical protein [Bradyrhizobium guangdongense]
MMEMPGLLEVRCCDPQEFDGEVVCACGDSERVLRAIQRGEVKLTDEQREWCLSEIESVEGYTRDEYAMADDITIAQGVMCAWTDYCRDKGLL